MNLNPIIFFSLVIAIVTLSITIVILVVYLVRTIKKLKSENKLALNDEGRNKAIKIIDEANSKALDIIQKANLFAKASGGFFEKELKSVMDRELQNFEKSSQDFIKEYQNVLQNLKAKNVEIFQNLSKNIESGTLSQIKEFADFVEQETIASRKMVKRKIHHEYSLARKHVDAYIESELKIADEKIYEILETVSKQVLGHAIKLNDHENLIIEALEKAKKEGLFNDEK